MAGRREKGGPSFGWSLPILFTCPRCGAEQSISKDALERRHYVVCSQCDLVVACEAVTEANFKRLDAIRREIEERRSKERKGP